MVMTTAAAAATRTAIAAVSTVMEVARAVISQSRRALKAPRWAARSASRVENPYNALLNAHAQGTHTDSSEPLDRWPYSAAAARNTAISVMKAVANQSSSGEISEVMGSRRPVHEGASRALVSPAPRPVHGFGRAGNKN